ncbi:MAG: hypothetical protein ACLRVU_03415 [Beduini sp.]|uniref:hypothetical protein n=1 Tax=Beduini sp. TaxID=1922300 RepID=UPI00399EF85B
MYKVYAKLDTNNCIISIEGTAFHTEQELTDQGYIYIDEGEDGDVYGHCQPNYLIRKYGYPIIDAQFRYNYKLVDMIPTLLTDEEKESLYSPVTYQPSEQEKINSQLILEIAKLKAGIK